MTALCALDSWEGCGYSNQLQGNWDTRAAQTRGISTNSGSQRYGKAVHLHEHKLVRLIWAASSSFTGAGPWDQRALLCTMHPCSEDLSSSYSMKTSIYTTTLMAQLYLAQHCRIFFQNHKSAMI